MMARLLSSTYLAGVVDDMCVLLDEDGVSFSFVDRETVTTALYLRALGWFDLYGRDIAEHIALRSMSVSLADLIERSHKEIADDAVADSARLGLSYYQCLWLYAVGVGALRDRLGDLALHEVGASCRAH